MCNMHNFRGGGLVTLTKIPNKGIKNIAFFSKIW